MFHFNTELTRLFDIPHPVMLAPMGGAVGVELASAVANAGGLACLPLSWSSSRSVATSLKDMQSATTAKFGANLCLANPQDERLEVCLSHGVGFVHFFWGEAAPYVSRVHDAGCLVMQTVSDSEGARRAVDAGVDVLVAQGWEAGGHVRGEVATMALIPAVVSAAKGVPVIAAGGIANGRGLAAALCLGADGAMMGTRFLASKEADAHPDYVAEIISAGEHQTCCTPDLFNVGWSDAQHRALLTPFAQQWFADGKPDNATRARAGEVVAMTGATEVVAYQSATPRKTASGDIRSMSLWAGQSVGQVSRVASAASIVTATSSEAKSILSGFTSSMEGT